MQPKLSPSACARHEPRVLCSIQPLPFCAMKFGENLILLYRSTYTQLKYIIWPIKVKLPDDSFHLQTLRIIEIRRWSLFFFTVVTQLVQYLLSISICAMHGVLVSTPVHQTNIFAQSPPITGRAVKPLRFPVSVQYLHNNKSKRHTRYIRLSGYP